MMLFTMLAMFGGAAVLVRLGEALLRTGKYSLERYVAAQIVEQRGSRGDLSGMSEAEKVRAAAAAKQMRFLGLAALWAALLGLPLLITPAIIFFPLYSIFWYLPRRGNQVVPS